MIVDQESLRHYLNADLASAGLPKWRPWMRFKYPILHWQRQLRRTEYLINTRTAGLWKPYVLWRRFNVRRDGMRLGFSIPPNVFGPGLSLPHWGTIVVNDNARVGANCRIHPSTCLGEQKGKAPQIGRNCYIGPGAKLYGDIVLGDNVTIGANSVVNKSFGSDMTLVGAPATPVQRRRLPR